MSNHHGDFIWYELMTTDADAARGFYEAVIGWSIEAEPSGPIDYRMISASEGNVAGLLPLTGEMTAAGARPCWVPYIAVDDVDLLIGSMEQGGGAVHLPARTVDGIGRIAMVADPQGASFYIMKPTPPAGQPDAVSNAFSYDRPRIGHCAWNELATADVEGAKHFYLQRFGWVQDGEMDMGAMGRYEFLRHALRAPEGSPMGVGVFGAVMAKPPQAPTSTWTHYFRVPDIDAAFAQIEAKGGSVTVPPMEIPGGEFSMNAIDPQGAHFGLVGGRLS